METTFENAKVGDRVYSPLFVGKGETNGEIIKILNGISLIHGKICLKYMIGNFY